MRRLAMNTKPLEDWIECNKIQIVPCSLECLNCNHCFQLNDLATFNLKLLLVLYKHGNSSMNNDRQVILTLTTQREGGIVSYFYNMCSSMKISNIHQYDSAFIKFLCTFSEFHFYFLVGSQKFSGLQNLTQDPPLKLNVTNISHTLLIPMGPCHMENRLHISQEISDLFQPPCSCFSHSMMNA